MDLPESWPKNNVKKGEITSILVTGAYVTTLLYFNQSKETANTVAFFSLAFSQLLHVFNMREHEEHVFKNQVTCNRYIWMALAIGMPVLAIAYFVPVLCNSLSLEQLTWQGWLIKAIASATVLMVIQLMKQLFKI